MSVGIDERSNSLVVRAPDPLFFEVQQLVQTLDTAETAFPEATRIVNLTASNSAAVQRALSAIYGGAVQTTASPESPQAGQPGANGTQPPGGRRGPQQQEGPNPGEFLERIRRFQEFQQRMMQGGEAGGGPESRGGPRGPGRGRP